LKRSGFVESLLNQRFGKVIVKEENVLVGRRKYVKVICDCGNEKLIRAENIKSVKSCGCLKRNPFGLNSHDYEILYNVWRNMIRRCYDKTSDRYYTYGARGIKVCDEWKNNFHCFAKFAVDNGWKVGLSIERKNLNENYCPSNCTFITMKEQTRNKTSNVMITHNGKTKCVVEWCEALGVNPKTVYRRIQLGHTDFDVIFYNGDIRELRKIG
jgi:hypothetical protein